MSSARVLSPDLPSTVDHDDASIRKRFNGHPLGMPREQAMRTAHGLTFTQLARFVADLPYVRANCRYNWWAICRP